MACAASECDEEPAAADVVFDPDDATPTTYPLTLDGSDRGEASGSSDSDSSDITSTESSTSTGQSAGIGVRPLGPVPPSFPEACCAVETHKLYKHDKPIFTSTGTTYVPMEALPL